MFFLGEGVYIKGLGDLVVFVISKAPSTYNYV